jgi:transposase
MQNEDTTPTSADILEYIYGTSHNRCVQLRYNYRLYPSPGQRDALARAFGCARVVFSDGLRARQEAHEAGLPYITDAELSARLTAAKTTPERAWLGEVSAVVLQQSLADLNTAYRNFFASVAGKRKGPKTGPPRFKSRKDHRQVADARREFHHQLSTTLIRDNQAVAVEDLAVKGLARTHMAKSVHDAGWAAWLDRDINAAVNVAKAAGLAVSACGAQVRPGPALAQRSEAGTHPKSR